MKPDADIERLRYPSNYIVPLQHGKYHDKKENLLRMQQIKPLFDLAGRILDKHQKSAKSQPSHEKKRNKQPVVGPQGHIAMNAGNHKSGGIQPDVVYQQPVKMVLDIFDVIFDPDPFGREIDICRQKKNHAQVA